IQIISLTLTQPSITSFPYTTLFRSNYALRADMTEAEFVKEVTDGLLPPPAYFPENVRLNKNGYEAIDTIIEKNKAFTPAEFKQRSEEHTSELQSRENLVCRLLLEKK